ANMDPETSRNARESLELAFQMSNILETGLDRHTLSVLVALCEKGLNPESLAALKPDLQQRRVCVGCCMNPTRIVAVDEPPKGLRIQGRTMKKRIFRALACVRWTRVHYNLNIASHQSAHQTKL
ncbi:hypothetical protein C5167_035024, partial [Papaver somniferum]